MFNIKNSCWLLALIALSEAGYTNENSPVSVKKINQLITQHFEVLDIPPAVSVGQQKEGGIVVWLGSSKRSGIVAALQNYTSESSRLVIDGRNLLYSYSASGMGGGFQNDAIITAAQGTIGSGPYVLINYANAYSTTPEGEDITPPINNKNDITCSETCLGGWYIPNLGEFKVMFKSLCETPYALDSGEFEGNKIYYWTSTQSLTGQGLIKVVHIPANHNCDISQLEVSDIEQDYTLPTGTSRARFVRQFG